MPAQITFTCIDFLLVYQTDLNHITMQISKIMEQDRLKKVS